ncbi:S41 family peptidase [Candidatus Woesebacteria bacterium]|nr:S41 family peptidase [Candidatus Woesebacteria bacterium]
MQENVIAQTEIRVRTPKRKFGKYLLKVTKIIFSLLIIISVFFGGYYLGVNGYETKYDDSGNVTIDRQNPESREDLDFGLFWRVWDTLDARYFDSEMLDPRKMVYGAIKGMVASIGDPYTAFFPPKENKVVQEDLQGEFGGVGIQIGFKGSQLAVVAPIEDSPAHKAGIEAGDYIMGIRDEKKGIDRNTVGITIQEAVQDIRGEIGTSVTLTLLREGTDDPIIADVVRDTIDVPSLSLEFIGEGENIAHIRVIKFSQELVEEWDDAVVEILSKPDVEGIIVDVRNNPGGYLEHAVELASDFLETGETAVIEESAGKARKDYKVERIGRLRDRDVVVLINGGSASASEILAGALRDMKEYPLVGKTSFGKGTIQESQQVNGGAGLHITIARWLTPSEFWVNEGGLVPDYEVDNDPNTFEDKQLEKAVELLS